jgi:cytochrome bd-type quinol oxidase subunit 2
MKSNTRLIIILLAVPVILLIPFVAMQFTEEVNWSTFDFLVMGILLLLIGLKIEYILRKVKRKQNRIAVISIILIVFLLIWAELAVGIFGTPFAGS